MKDKIVQEKELEKIDSRKGGIVAICTTIVEVGGRNKGGNQITDIPNSWILKDDTITATGRTIPLWLFGFLY